MAREAVVSRTFITHKVTVLCLNVVSCEPSNHTYDFDGSVKDLSKVLKKLKAEHETDEIKLVQIVDVTESAFLVEMPIEQFLALGTRKAARGTEKKENE